MTRLSELLLQEIELELSDGTSLNTISKEYNIGKSTLYYYYKKIKGKKFVSPYVLPRLSEEAGEVVGIFAGDGSQYFEPKNYHYEVNVHFGGKKLAYASNVKLLFENFFRKSFRLQKEPLDRLRLRTYSKQIFLFFNNSFLYFLRIDLPLLFPLHSGWRFIGDVVNYAVYFRNFIDNPGGNLIK